jgi:hypothetical protein
MSLYVQMMYESTPNTLDKLEQKVAASRRSQILMRQSSFFRIALGTVYQLYINDDIPPIFPLVLLTKTPTPLSSHTDPTRSEVSNREDSKTTDKGYIARTASKNTRGKRKEAEDVGKSFIIKQNKNHH